MKETASAAAAAPGNVLLRMGRAWNDFWFRPADPLPLGLVRICCGMLLVYIHLAYSYDLQEFFGKNAWLDLEAANEFRRDVPVPILPSGWQHTYPPVESEAERERIEHYVRTWDTDPRLVYTTGNYLWSVWFHVTDPVWMVRIHIAVIGVMFLFTIGFCTRITSVLSWMGLMCYAQRSPGSLFGMDAIMNVVTFYLMIGPSGAALSVDRLITRYWTTWRALRRHRPAPSLAVAPPMISANVALRLLQIHFCIIYLASGTSKLLGSAWWNGTALWFTLANYEFSPMRYSWFYDMLWFLCEHRWLWEIVMAGGVLYTLVLEIGFPFLVWIPRLRGVMVVGAIMLHTGIAFTMGLNTFGIIMITMVISFVPADTIRRMFGLLGRHSPKLRLRFNGQALRQVRAASLVRACDLMEQVTVEDRSAAKKSVRSVLRDEPASAAIQEEHAEEEIPAAPVSCLQLVTPPGKVLTGYALFEYLVRSIRFLWPVALLTWVPGVDALGKKWYPSVSVPSEPSPAEEERLRRPRKENFASRHVQPSK